jgi:HSP20 family protein
VRYRYVDLKYTRRGRSETVSQDIWESFGIWPIHSAIIWRPSTDIYETPDSIIVVIELAGVSEEDMAVTLFSDLLVVEGTREQPLMDMSACHQLGIKYGDFRSEVSILIPVDHGTANVEYQNGLLKVILKKLEE